MSEANQFQIRPMSSGASGREDRSRVLSDHMSPANNGMAGTDNMKANQMKIMVNSSMDFRRIEGDDDPYQKLNLGSRSI